MKIKMPAHRLILDDVFEQPFKLIAIHSSVEEYKLAFLLNKHLGLRLSRASQDVDFRIRNLKVLFALYQFEDIQKYCKYFLVSNFSKGETALDKESRGLFRDEQFSFEKMYFLPEFKKVDFFLKIEEESNPVSEKLLLNKIKEIPQVSTAYGIDFHQIKSKENLIFD